MPYRPTAVQTPTIPGPDGKPYKTRSVEFTIRKEGHGTYDTEDGITVRLRAVVVRIFVAINDHGEVVKLPNGEPLVSCQTQNLVTAEMP